MAFDVQTDKTEVEKNYGELTASIDQHGETLHQEITAIVNQRISAIQEMKNKHLSTLDKNTEEIERGIMELKQTISHVKSMLQSNDDYLMSTYKSRNSEFRTLPPKVRATFPKFSPPILNKHFLDEMCGSLSSLSINKEHGGTMESPEAVPHPPIKPLLKKTLSTAVIDTKHRELCGVRCLGEEVWTCGNDKFMKLLNLKGELLTSIQTKSGNVPFDIAVTREGDLVYSDYDDKTVNLVKNKQIRTVIKLQGWIPLNLCSTSSDDLMVIMISDDGKQSKIVRYSDATQKQIIQSDEQGRPLYSSYAYIKYISENGNLDICVADRGASAVVVVNLSGKLRFKYTGHPDKSSASFYPFGISTDSQRQILTADYYNDRIHILDQDGQFLQYIQNRTLRSPYGLCVDNSDNLFVAEFGSAKVKRIQYI